MFGIYITVQLNRTRLEAAQALFNSLISWFGRIPKGL